MLTFVDYQANPYLTVVEADDYFETRLYSEAWAALTDVDKEKALYMATRKIESLPIAGSKVSTDQTLQFPRRIYSWSQGAMVDEVEVSQEVKDAVCEEALSIITTFKTASKRAEMQAQGVKSFSIDGVSETFAGGSRGDRLISRIAEQLLTPYIGGGRCIG